MTSIKPKPDETALVTALARVLDGQRAQFDLTVRDLAEQSGVSKSTWDRLQRGETLDPSVIALDRWAKVFGLTSAQLLDLAGEHMTRDVPRPRKSTKRKGPSPEG